VMRYVFKMQTIDFRAMRYIFGYFFFFFFYTFLVGFLKQPGSVDIFGLTLNFTTWSDFVLNHAFVLDFLLNPLYVPMPFLFALIQSRLKTGLSKLFFWLFIGYVVIYSVAGSTTGTLQLIRSPLTERDLQHEQDIKDRVISNVKENALLRYGKCLLTASDGLLSFDTKAGGNSKKSFTLCMAGLPTEPGKKPGDTTTDPNNIKYTWAKDKSGMYTWIPSDKLGRTSSLILRATSCGTLRTRPHSRWTTRR
ncbi:MAG: hypothetical protein GXP63_06845, partial [DPANN group archaeon]|nr:hypothetical protein [DPANN group archaeon]